MKSKEMERIMSTIDISTMTKGELVEEIDRQLACAKCRSLGMLASPLGVDGGVKYCACRFGSELYQRDMACSDIIAPITREWRLFPKSQYGTPEFLQLCMDQAAEARKAGRLACANALDRYVERELLSAKPGESIALAAKRAERLPPTPPQMEVVKD